MGFEEMNGFDINGDVCLFSGTINKVEYADFISEGVYCFIYSPRF